MITNPNIQGAIRDRADNNIWDLVGSGTPTSGTSGTGNGFAGPGSSYVRTDTGAKYINTNTKTSPTWTAQTPAAGAITEAMLVAASTAGLGAVRYAKSKFSFAVDGGAQGAIKPVSGATLPSKTIILGGVLDITTAFTSGGSATLALGTDAGSAANSILAATAVASLTAVVTTVLIPKFTAATIVKLTAAGVIQWTIATADMTAGIASLTLAYIVGD